MFCNRRPHSRGKPTSEASRQTDQTPQGFPGATSGDSSSTRRSNLPGTCRSCTCSCSCRPHRRLHTPWWGHRWCCRCSPLWCGTSLLRRSRSRYRRCISQTGTGCWRCMARLATTRGTDWWWGCSYRSGTGRRRHRRPWCCRTGSCRPRSGTEDRTRMSPRSCRASRGGMQSYRRGEGSQRQLGRGPTASEGSSRPRRRPRRRAATGHVESSPALRAQRSSLRDARSQAVIQSPSQSVDDVLGDRSTPWPERRASAPRNEFRP